MIVEMKKAYVVGLVRHLDSVLAGLQDLGVVDVVRVSKDQPDSLETQKRALRRLEAAMRALSQATPEPTQPTGLTPEEVVARTEQIAERTTQIGEDISKLQREIARLSPWGDFDPSRIRRLAEEESIYVQLFEVSGEQYESAEIPESVEVHTVREEGDRLYLAAVASAALQPGLEEVELPEEGLNALKERVRGLEEESEALAAEFEALKGHLKMLKESWEGGTDRLHFDEAKAALVRSGEIFYLEGWVPSTQEAALRSEGGNLGFMAHTEDPGPDETPPSLIHNDSVGVLGEPLVRIYDTPNYKDIDPSSPVFFFFALFFGMIIGDGGYGLILLALSLFLRFTVKKKSAKRFLTLCTVLSCTCVLYGVLSNTFFARPMVPIDSEVRRWIAPLSVTTYEELEQLTKVMMISIWMGAIHIAWVSILKARHRRIVAPYGWVVALAGALLLTRSLMDGGLSVLEPLGYALMAAGVTWNVLCRGVEAGRGFGRRLGASLAGLQGVIQMFSDVLSYLRLFALGMATVYMGTTFNMLSGMVWKGAPLVVGIVACPLILLFGHTINLVLSIMGGVIHGLRLNFIESYHWYFEGGGRSFTPFRRLRTTS